MTVCGMTYADLMPCAFDIHALIRIILKQYMTLLKQYMTLLKQYMTLLKQYMTLLKQYMTLSYVTWLKYMFDMTRGDLVPCAFDIHALIQIILQ